MNDRKVAMSVGLMVIVVATIFFSLIAVLSKWKTGDEGFSIKLRFGFLNSLSEGASVQVAGGIPVGYVKKIYQTDLKTYVQLHLNEELKNKIPKNHKTQFAIYTAGLMGQKYININIAKPKKDDEFFKEGDEWRGIDPPSIDQMMLAFSSWFDGKNGGRVLAQIMQATQRFVSNLNGIVGENRSDIRKTIKQARTSFSNLTGQLDVLMKKLTKLSSNFTEISNKNKKDIEVMLLNMSLISRDLNLITQRVNSGRGSVGKLLTDESLYKNANSAVRHAKELMKMLRVKPWLLIHKDN